MQSPEYASPIFTFASLRGDPRTLRAQKISAVRGGRSGRGSADECAAENLIDASPGGAENVSRRNFTIINSPRNFCGLNARRRTHWALFLRIRVSRVRLRIMQTFRPGEFYLLFVLPSFKGWEESSRQFPVENLLYSPEWAPKVNLNIYSLLNLLIYIRHFL